MKTHFWVLLCDLGGNAGKKVKGMGFPGTDVDLPGDSVLCLRKLCLGQLHKAQHLLGSASQDHTFFCQRDSAVTALKKRHAEIFLQFLHLP